MATEQTAVADLTAKLRHMVNCSRDLRAKIGGVQPDFANPMLFAQLQQTFVQTLSSVEGLLTSLSEVHEKEETESAHSTWSKGLRQLNAEYRQKQAMSPSGNSQKEETKSAHSTWSKGLRQLSAEYHQKQALSPSGDSQPATSARWTKEL